MRGQWETIPAELRERQQWVNWRFEQRAGDPKPTKVLRNARTGGHAQSTNPATWASFEEALEALRVFPENDGLGFVFAADDPYVGIDLDGCIDADGQVAEWAQAYIGMVPTYWERSQSRRGVHGIARGKLPAEHRRAGPVEMYEEGRFFVMTGDHLEGSPARIADRAEEILRLHAEVFAERNKRAAAAGSTPAAGPVSLDDREALDKLYAETSGPKWRQLYQGDWEGAGYGSQSEADLALCSKLAFYVGGDPGRISRLFEGSGLMREKWTRSDYRDDTISKAVSGCREFYQPAMKRRRNGAAADAGEGESRDDEGPPDLEDGDSPEGEAAIKAPSEDKLATEWADTVRGRFLFAEGDEWWRYDDRCWRPISDSTIDAQIHDWLKGRGKGKRVSVRQKRIREIRFLASAKLGDGGQPVPRLTFNSNRHLLPLANGMLNVETRTLTPHSPAHRNTYALPYGYDATARCPRFDQFLCEVMLREDGSVCAEWIDTLERWMGYCLIPDCRAETVLLNVGEGGNGKSLWAKVLEALVGDVNCCSVDPRQLELKPDYTLASLYGKLVGFLNEPTRNQLAGCYGAIKALVSGDLVQARQPYRQPFDYRPHIRLVVSCNDVPQVSDQSRGWYRRMLMIEWRYQPTNPDRRLDRKLLEELPGVLNLALDGLGRLRENEWEFEEPEESKTLKRDYKHDQDSAAQFLADCCTCDPQSEELWCNAVSLYHRYAAWAKEAGYQALNAAVFGKHLTKRLGYPPSRAKKVNGRIFKARYGILLNDPLVLGMEEEAAGVLVQ